MPLAIELAAAALGDRSVVTLLAELRVRLEKWAGTERNRPNRQRSMQAVFDYSWDQLAPDAQRALARLGVFRDPFDDRLAADVAGAGRKMLRLLETGGAGDAGW